MSKTRTANPQTRGRPAKYPYARWFDGKPHTITQGVHFDCQRHNMEMTIFRAAGSQGLRLDCERVGEESLKIQAKG
jgi:hypothetical protein